MIMVLSLLIVLSCLGFQKLFKYAFLLWSCIFLIIGCSSLVPLAFYWHENKVYKHISADQIQKLQDGKYGGLIILGGALDTKETVRQQKLTVNANANRFVHADRLLRLKPENVAAIYSGGSSFLTSAYKDILEAELFDEYLINPDKNLYLEKQSRNTYENAVFSKALYRSEINETWPNEKPWLLVTSAYHMPRAYAVFIKQGWNIEPYAAPNRDTHIYKISFSTKFWDNWYKADVLAKEFVGMIAYKLTDKI